MTSTARSPLRPTRALFVLAIATAVTLSGVAPAHAQGAKPATPPAKPVQTPGTPGPLRAAPSAPTAAPQTPGPQTPEPQAPRKATPVPPTAAGPAPRGQVPGGQKPSGSIAACDYITPDEAKGLLGADVAPTTAPSKGLFTSCGYTSPAGGAVTVYVADYGLPSVGQQFFDKTRELLKTTHEETLGVPAFSYATAAAGTAAGGAAVPPAATFGATTVVALKDQRMVKIEAAGPVAGLPQQLPKLRAILTRVLGTLPAPAPPAPSDPPR